MPTALTGEGPLLSPPETVSVWDTVFTAAAGAVPVIPAVIATRTKTGIALAQAAERLGAPAVMVAAVLPELYAGRSWDDVYGFHAEIAGRSACR
jgi:dihydrodipicolinate synthase/N-acetylneuraminate lyase